MAIQIRRGSDAGWESNKSNIVAGEPVITTDTGRLFVGTGNGTFAEYAQASRTVNGKALTSNVELFAHDIPSKNILPNMAYTRFVSGVTFTVNNDGSITASGTATANIRFDVGAVIGDGGSYILSGCSSGSSTTYRLNLYDSSSTMVAQSITGDSSPITLQNGDEYAVRIYINSGATVSSVKFYPMMRRSDILNNTYVPYAITNPIPFLNNFPMPRIKGYQSIYIDTAGTGTLQLSKSVGYLVAVVKHNTSNGSYNGLYFIQSHTQSNILPILTSACTTLSMNSDALLTATTTQNYCSIIAIPLMDVG